MSQKNTQISTQNSVESTPKMSKWDKTPLVRHDLNADLKRSYDQTPNRVEQTPSRFS